MWNNFPCYEYEQGFWAEFLMKNDIGSLLSFFSIITYIFLPSSCIVLIYLHN